MTAIVTLTPNPSLDVTTTVEQVMPTYKLSAPLRGVIRGGGINVARVGRRLGGEVTAVYPCAA
jgi:6-phosphofructokinase 2